METVIWWSIKPRGIAISMTRQCGCKVLWNNELRVDDEWVIYPCFRHAHVKGDGDATRKRIVEESRALQFDA